MRLAATLVLLCSTAAAAAAAEWPQLDRFVATFVSPEGRVVEHSAADRTTSEGQAYALFFALVNDDRPLFDRLLAWTAKNLARGELRHILPAWEWGADAHQRWGVLDRTSASDADLWLGYTLLEAGRLWDDPRYDRLGRALLANVVSHEVVSLKQLGPMVLPAPFGFVLAKDKRWRLNPSYLPLQILRRLHSAGVPGPWVDLPATTVRMIRETSAAGFVPDWVVWDAAEGFGFDPVSGPIGSYDGIRVYLWAAMLDAGDPLRTVLGAAIGGPVALERKGASLPEKLNLKTGTAAGGQTPPGYTAVVLAASQAAGDAAAIAAARQTLDDNLHDGLYVLPGDVPRYYDQVMALFARGFVEGRFHFGPDGALQPAWKQ